MKKKRSQGKQLSPEKRRSAASKYPTIENMTFSRLILEHKQLAEARQKYASIPAEKRRRAAEYEYDSSAGAEIFDRMPSAVMGEHLDREDRWYQVCLSLAMDPSYGPAILSVGSLEYQYNRIDEAMNLFLSLVDLPEDTKDLSSIIDEAGGFLIDQGNYQNATRLYGAAAKKYPNMALYYSSLGYCHGKLSLHREAVMDFRKALELEPDNYAHLNDLGWSLSEAGTYNEAKIILERAIALSPEDYDYVRNNLKELKKRMKGVGNRDVP